jgi:hypothetical protein
MDEMLQVDPSSAENLHWNDSDAFLAGWGMSISARLLGWSAGAFKLQASNGTVSARSGIPAVSIDLVPAYALAILHFELAGVIVLFAIFCALIPKIASTGTDLRTARAKLSYFSTLMAEVVEVRSVVAPPGPAQVTVLDSSWRLGRQGAQRGETGTTGAPDEGTRGD